MAEMNRRVWASVHGIVACRDRMAHGDIYAPGPQVFIRWHVRGEPVYVVGFEIPDWLPDGVEVVYA